MIRVFNTLTRTKEEFQPTTPGKVGMYLCGPTVYKPSHIGHMVGPVIFDAIKRYLTYSGFETTWVVNITDVDDKLIAESQKRGIPMSAVADEMTQRYRASMVGSVQDILFEEPSEGYFTGHAPNYVRVYAEGGDLHNQIRAVRITDIYRDGVLGIIE
jgi:tRNA A37 methylthiotransferase MiaB